MTDPIFDGDDEGNTPLTPEEREGLKPSWIATRAELNRAEFDNIARAGTWAAARPGDILEIDTLSALHRRMFGHPTRSKESGRRGGGRMDVQLELDQSQKTRFAKIAIGRAK